MLIYYRSPTKSWYISSEPALLRRVLLSTQVGFFKRKRLSEYQAARMSSRQQQEKAADENREQLPCKSP